MRTTTPSSLSKPPPEPVHHQGRTPPPCPLLTQSGHWAAEIAVTHNTVQCCGRVSPPVKLERRVKPHATVRRKAMKTRHCKTTKAKPNIAPKPARRSHSPAAKLQEHLDRRTRELDEALAHQAATSEVLNVIRRHRQMPNPYS